MFWHKKALSVVEADKIKEGLIITFSDGVTAIYHTQFLYDMRDADHNVPLTEQGGVPAR